MISGSNQVLRKSRVLAVVAALAVGAPMLMPSAAAAEPSATDKETARGLVVSGRAKRQKGDAAGALADFKAAWALVKNPTTGLELGKQQAEMALLAEARDTLLEVARMPAEKNEAPALTRAREEAKRLADDLAPKIPSIKLTIVGVAPGEPVEVRVDDRVVVTEALAAPIKLNPGIHTVIVKQADAQKSAEVMLGRGEQRELKIDLERTADKTPMEVGGGGKTVVVPTERAPHWLVWAGLSVAGAGAIAGGITGGFAIARSNEVAAGCPNQTCPPALHDTLDEANALAIGSTVSFAVGGAGLAAMIVGLFLPGEPISPDEAEPAARAFVFPGGVGVSGTF
jgi:hypothetical protein